MKIQIQTPNKIKSFGSAWLITGFIIHSLINYPVIPHSFTMEN